MRTWARAENQTSFGEFLPMGGSKSTGETRRRSRRREGRKGGWWLKVDKWKGRGVERELREGDSKMLEDEFSPSSLLFPRILFLSFRSVSRNQVLVSTST